MGAIYQAIDVPGVLDAFNIQNFVETGTGDGHCVEYLVSLPVKLDIYSIELMDVLYEDVVERFGHTPNLNLIRGYSHIEIKNVLDCLSDGPTLFWHDAHFPGADFHIDGATYTSEPDPTKRIPLQAELTAIIESGRDISSDVFVLDDLRVYKDGPYPGGNWPLRSQAGADGIQFIYDLFEDTHAIHELYIVHGFVVMAPKTSADKILPLIKT